LDGVTEEWRTGLDGMDGEAIKQALEHCRRNCAWPPSIAEFRAAGTDGSTAEQRAFQALAAEQQAALPSETWAEIRERGKAELAKLREQLAR